MIDHNVHPRDWDLRIEMPDEDFTRRFSSAMEWITEGGTGQWTIIRWTWSDECVKRTKDAWAATGLNVDFQIYPKTQCQSYRGKPKVRLDTTVWRKDGKGRIKP